MHPWHWKPAPDFQCLIDSIYRKGDPNRIPLLELFADPEIIGAVLGEIPAPAKEETA